jgi:hypothetical protein
VEDQTWWGLLENAAEIQTETSPFMKAIKVLPADLQEQGPELPENLLLSPKIHIVLAPRPHRLFPHWLSMQGY